MRYLKKILKIPFIALMVLVVPYFFACNGQKNKAETDDAVAENEKVDSAIIAGKKFAAQLTDVTASTNLNELLCQGWEYEEDIENLTFSSEPEGNFPFRSFYLSMDNSFVSEPRGEIKFGNWKFDDATKLITLTQSNKQFLQYKLIKLSATELVIINTADADKKKLVFVAVGKKYTQLNDNPYHISNNIWRIAPKQPETDVQIKARLKNYLQFHINFYKLNLATQQQSISFYGFPSCIKWYAGGIILIKEKDLPKNWFTCFYNKDQAMQAYKMMEIIVTKKYNWPTKKMNWVVKNLAVLEQMYAGM
jgi:hypothetical protein